MRFFTIATITALAALASAQNDDVSDALNELSDAVGDISVPDLGDLSDMSIPTEVPTNIGDIDTASIMSEARSAYAENSDLVNSYINSYVPEEYRSQVEAGLESIAGGDSDDSDGSALNVGPMVGPITAVATAVGSLVYMLA